MALQELSHLGLDDLVAACPAVENAEAVLHFLWTIYRDRHPNVVVDQPSDDIGFEKRGVGGQPDLDPLAELGATRARVVDGRLQHTEVEQGFATKEGEMDHWALTGLAE